MKIDGQLSILGKNYKDFKLHYNKPSVEEIFIQRAVKMTKQVLYDKGVFDSFPNGDEVLNFFVCYKT